MNQQLALFHQQLKDLSQKVSLSSALEFFLQNTKGSYLWFEWDDLSYSLKLQYSKPHIPSICIRLYENEKSFHLHHLNQPLQIPAVCELVQKVSQQEMFPYWLTVQKDQKLGLFFLSQNDSTTKSLLYALKIQCESIIWREKYSELAPQDSFMKTLFSEISRARSLQMPVSLILIDSSSNSKVQRENINVLFRSLTQHLRKNIYMYDFIFRLSEHEMALILPHQSESQALDRAHKLYGILETLNQSHILNSHLIFQVCIAEYPHSGRDALHLLKLSRQACDSYRKQFRNQSGLTLAKAPQNFKPDYQPRYMEDFLELS